MPKITIYSTKVCPYCINAKMLLDSKGATYKEVAVDTDPKQWEKMQQRTGGARTVPQIFIGDYHVGGFDDLSALNSAGKLDPLLKG